MLVDHENIFPIDGTIITHPKVWEASGHVGSFADAMVESTGGPMGNKRYRADHLIEEMYSEEELKTADETVKRWDQRYRCLHEVIKGKKSSRWRNFGAGKKFSLMVETSLGVVEGDKKVHTLRVRHVRLFISTIRMCWIACIPKFPLG